PFFAVAMIAFATCTVAFLVMALIERERSLRVVFTDLRTFLLMNLCTACAWLCYFQSLRHLEPAVANVLHAGLGPLTIMMMAAVVATRFLGVLAAAVIALSLGPDDARHAATSAASWKALAPAAFMLMAVPIYLNQIGVKRASPLTVRVLLALGPMFLIALQTI